MTFISHLEPPIFTSGASGLFFDEIDSTSLEARRRIDRGDVDEVWIISNRQTAGYGRRGTAWDHLDGNLAATYLFSPAAPPDRFPQLSFVAALALCDAISAFTNRGTISLKWPNDVLVDGKKIAGLLLEFYPLPGQSLIALGCGVNITGHPAQGAYEACHLSQFARAVPAALAMLEKIDACFYYLHREWADKGFAPIRRAWLDQAHGLGERIVVRLNDREEIGTFCDIDADGSLIVETDNGIKNYAAGTVFYQGSR